MRSHEFELEENVVTCIIFHNYVAFYRSVYELIDVIIENLLDGGLKLHLHISTNHNYELRYSTICIFTWKNRPPVYQIILIFYKYLISFNIVEIFDIFIVEIFIKCSRLKSNLKCMLK